MSREGANNRIDSIKNSLNTDQYSRSALGNAVRFNTMLNVLNDFSEAQEQNSSRTNKFTLNDFSSSLERSVSELREDFDNELLDEENNNVNRRFDSENTIQQKLSNRAYKTSLGQTVANSTVQRKGMYQDFNTSYSTGATGAFRSFTNGFVQDDEDFFGSRVLYDNVFGQYEDGGESLSSKARIAASDPTNDTRTVSEKVLDNVVNKSIYDQTEIVDRVDIEFGRFHGNSMIDQMSMTGSGLKAARQTIRTVMQEGSAYGRQVAARGEDDHPIVLAQALSDRTGNDLENVNTALNLLNNNLSNRSSTTNSPDGGYINKAGVAEFIDLINSAGTRDSNGSLTGGKISISTFQFQNETVSAALTDKIQRHVLESVLQGGGAPLEIDIALAYPRQRNTDKRQDAEGRYAVGMTNYSILGPNLIEALKMEEVKTDIQDMLVGLGVPKEDISKYVNLNIGFRDKKFHPKVYLTDNVASIGTQNLTAPVGSSVNQAGSNFETMRFVTNTFKNDSELEIARESFVPLGQAGLNQVHNNKITQSLLYRQIVDSVNQERLYSEGNNLNRSLGSTSTPILNNKTNSQVGFAGDIYQHLSNTLDFAHKNSFTDSQSSQVAGIRNSNSLHMFMVLDQSFMLQLGSNSSKSLLSGEMGEEIGTTPYDKDNIQAQRYKAQQNKLFDLLIADKANVVVDTKNFERQVIKPLLDKINDKDTQTGILKNQKLKSNFEKYGQSFSMMAGFELLKPTSSANSDEYNKSLKVMFKELRRLGFTKEAGFEEDDLKQIIGLASNNIERANVPKQHAKEFGLFDYSTGSTELISYYQGSSNMGLYSLGIESGEDGRYMPGDGNLTNTEMGIMLGRRDIDSNLSRATQANLRLSPDYAFEQNIYSTSKNQWALNKEEEEYELMLAQRHFSTTWSQLARTNLESIKTKQFSSAPSWQENVNSKDLVVLKTRLETMSKDLGLSPDIFTITEKYGDKSGAGLTSINVSIDMSRIMSSTEFMKGTNSNLPRLNFELSVLQGPSRGEGMFHNSAEEGDASGYVYFVDKNRVVGNGLFTNDSGKDVSILGRHKYEDNFENDIHKGRINLKSGQSAHMSSLDIVPQLFATLMGEAVNRFGTKESMKLFDTSPDNAANFNMASVKELLLNYVAVGLTGYSSQMDESIKEGSNIVSSMKLIQDNLDILSLQDLNETINRHTRSVDNEMDSGLYQSKDPLQRKRDKDEVSRSLEELNNKWFHILKGGKTVSEGDVEFYINDLFELAQKSPQLANMIVKTAYKDPNKTSKLLAFKEFQTLLFGSFLQTKDERTYGGQQGFYKTLLMGVGNSTIDKNTADLMFDLDTEKEGLHNLNAYARFKPLEYTPLTDIHDVLYRSIASKSTSLTKNDDRLDSIMFESEARDLGDAANLRLMSSLGIGSVLNRDDFIQRNEAGEREIGGNQKEIFEAMERAMIASGSDPTAINNARQMYLDTVEKEFGDLDSEDRKDTIRLRFYTGNAKKLSQLPQRIKNAMGARPMYQFSIDAQMALERGESLNELSDNYLQQHRQPIVSATKNKVERLLEERERLVSQYGESHERVTNIDNQIDDLKIIGSKAFNSKVSGLGAIFSGRIKSVLNQEQINFITKTKERLQASMGDLIQQGELSQSVLDELIRVEVLKAGLTNKGLGKMIVGNNHMNYGMAFIQLSGTYNDTSLNNPLYGTVYHSKDKYDSIRKHSIDIYDNTLSAMDRDYLGVYTLGQKEGHYDTKQESVKGSMIGAGGMEVLLQADDIIVEDKSTGNFVHKRKVNGEWIVIGQVDDSRNVQSVRNVVDRTGFSEVGSTTIGSSTMSAYGRKGENSVDYIYTAENRAGVFANNEYLLTFDKIRAMDPGSARRVEGTDSGALIKAVATFAGRVKYSSIQDNSLANREMNVFENIEEQIMRSYEAGEIKGSLKAYLDARDETQRVTLQDGRTGYAPLSSSIHGLYNANNFKSFFWSHGATILRAQTEDSRSFMLDSLFDTSSDKTSVDSAKKLAGALLVNFGTDFLQTKEANNSQENITQLKRSLISEMIKGEFGSHYQGVALEQTRVLGGRVEEIFSNEKLRKGRNKEQIVSDLLYEKIGNQVGFNASKVGALSAVSSEQLSAVLKGDSKASTDLLNLVRQGIMDPVAKQAQAIGGINFNNSAHTQAALIVTAVDLMHQITSKGSKLKIASDIDFDNDKVKDILLTVLGSSKSISDEETEDIMQFLSGVNSNVSTISVFTDIVFSYSKDATSTQSVARHEGQHLITPFLGDIKKYQEGGKLSHIQHTVASITAMVTGQESGMIFYDQMAKAGFKDKQAIDLTSEESNYLFSSFNKATYLGFYQSGVSGATTDNYVKEYKSINKLLLEGDYDWDSIQTVRDANDRTKFADEDESRLDFDEEGKPGSTAKAYAQVQRFVNKFHANESDLQKARRVDDYLMMGGDKFALHQLNELTTMMSIENARYQADPNKSTGRDTVDNLLKSMTNKRQYFSLPELSFEMQNGEIITRAQSNKLISTILPSAEEMRVLGAEYADFVDPILGHYKNLAAVFVPGTITNTAFEKVRLAARDNRAIVLSTEEYKAMSSVMDSARMMVPELAKASASSRTQEAFAGKNKYQGFTSTGIGNLLMPFDSVALAQSKLDEVGMAENLERFELMRQSDLAIKAIEEDRSYYIADDYRSPLLSEDPWLDSITGKTIPPSNSIDYKGKPELRSSRLLPPSKRPYFTQDERFGPTTPIKFKPYFLQDDRLGPQVEVATGFLDFDFLTTKFNQKGIQVNYKKDLANDVSAEYKPKLNLVNINDDMSASQKASTLLHELIHVYQNEGNIPLWGLPQHSNRANPEIHGSKAIDSNLNLKEWQAYSIEKHYEELQQKDPKKATEFLNKVVNAFDSRDQDAIKTTLGALGYKLELSDKYKQFTKYDIYSQFDSEDSTFFSKKDLSSNLEKTSLEAIEFAKSFKGGFISSNDIRPQLFMYSQAISAGVDLDSLHQNVSFLKAYEDYYRTELSESKLDYPAIANYAGNSYKEINNYRRGKMVLAARSAGTVATFDKLTSEISEVEAFNALESRLTFRGVASHVGHNLTVGQVMEDNAVLSTSLSKKQALDFANNNGTLYYIEGRGGANLALTGVGIPAEQEVLYKAGAQFEVTKIDTESERYHQVYLKEIISEGAGKEESSALTKAKEIEASLKDFENYDPDKFSQKEMRILYTDVVKNKVDIERFGFDFYDDKGIEFLEGLKNKENRLSKLNQLVVNKYAQFSYKKFKEKDTNQVEEKFNRLTDWHHLINSALFLDIENEDNIKTIQLIESGIFSSDGMIKFSQEDFYLKEQVEETYSRFLEEDTSEIINTLKEVRGNRFNTSEDISLSSASTIATDFTILTSEAYKQGLTLQYNIPKKSKPAQELNSFVNTETQGAVTKIIQKPKYHILEQDDAQYKKYAKVANKYKTRTLKDSTRENETEWQYVIRSFMDLDGSEKSSYIGQILEDRILGKELRDLPSEYEYLKDEIDTFQKKLNKESSKLEGHFQTAYDFTTKENKPFTIEEVLKQTSDAVYYSKKINQSNEEPAFFDNAKVVVDGDEFVYSEKAGGWQFAISEEFSKTASPGTDINLDSNLFKLKGLRHTLTKQLESTTDITKRNNLQKQIDIYNIRIKKGEDRLILINKEFNEKYVINPVESLQEELKITEVNTNQKSLENVAKVLDSTSIKDINPLGKNIINFYRRQKAAEAFGISKDLEKEFDNIKREAIETKNKISGFANVAALNADERKAAFDQLYSEIKNKRDIAYAMSSLDEKTGDSLSNKKNEYSSRVPSEADKYIYHAQALNYDAMLAEISLIGHQANLRPLTEQNVQDLERKRKKLGEVEFLLNSNQDVDRASTFLGLGKKSSSLAESALFTNKAISQDGGMVGQHMKAINSLSSEMRGLGMSKEATQIKNQYAVQQIDATIKMYEKRMEEMQAFSAERSVHSSKRNEKGELIIDEAVQRKIDSASSDYTNNTQKVIEYLKDKKSKFMAGVTITDQDIRNTFEDIDVKIAEVDTANIRLAEVFRSPTPGGTDPRLHTYRVMQGIAALNQVSNMLSDNRQIGAENKMIYSTERGQTATMMASLGVITYGGGDFDGDPYTVIFHQAADMQKLIQQKQSIVDQRKLSLDNVVKAADDLRSQINKIVVSDREHLKQREKLEEALQKREEQIEQIRNNLYSASNELNEAKSNFERQITDGHKGLQARARKQVANYMGLDERLFVSNKEIMFDTNGKVILDEDGQAQRGLNNEKTYDADAMFVFMEQGYKLMEGIESKNTSVLKMMDTVDLLTGYKTSPDVFQDGNFLKELTSRENLVRSPNGKISDESPAIGMLKNRVAQLQNTIQQLTPEQQQFVNNLKDADNDQYRAYLEQFNSLQKDMEGALSLHNLENQQKAEEKQKEFSKKAFMNQWIGGNIYSGVMANDTLNKFMVQGGGMTLTEGSFDMTLKTLGKAGGEVLGKTYNTIIGTTFQDAPVITYGRQMMDESSELYCATRTEFQNQAEGNTERRQIAEQNALSRGLERGTKKFDNAVRTELRSIGYTEFDEYVKVTQKAVLKSEGTQGFMKNIHQLLRDSIKLKDGDGDLQNKLQEASEEYDRLSKQISMNDEQGGDPTTRKDLLAQRDSIIGKMASNLGPGPGLKSLIDLDYLTNESSKTGLSRNDFESRFLTKGGIDSNRQMLNHYAASMDNLTEEERGHLLDPSTITEESGALLKVARNMTANNIANMVTSFRMSAIAVEGRGEIVKSFANSHKAKLATQLGHHTAVRPEGVMQDGVIGGEDQTGKYIKEKYGVIEAENNGAKFDVNRMHKNALGAHLGLEEAHLYNEDGTMSVAYRDKLEKASKKLNISTEEYVLMFDIHHETSREQVKGVFGEDGKQMEQFTVMNMMRKDIARSMLDGRVPGAEASKIINESMGSEVLTTMAQLASTNKLDSKGMEIFSSMYKGAIGYMLEATDGVVDVTRKFDGEVIQMKFSEMNAQQKQAYMTKLLHQQMLGTEASQESGFTRSTSQESRDFKNMNARVIANSKLIIDDMDGTLNGKLGNEFIDALDKAGANTLTGQQQEMYDAMSQEFVRSALDNDEEFDSLMRLSLPGKGDNVAGRKSDAEYRSQMKKKVRAQMKIRQEQDSKKYATSRSRHSQGRSVMNRSSFMNNINSSALDQLTTTAGSNALDLFVPLALTAVGSVIQDGSVDGEQLMQLGGASFTAFQYARTGTIESTTLSPTEYKKRLLSASAVGGIFKFKNALMREGDENVGAAVASVAVQEVTAAAFNTIATPWLSKNIAEHGLGVKHGPAMNALDMKKYQAGQQLAGNLGASLISAVSSTLISGLLMRGVESMSQNVGDAIQSFLPAVQAVSSVNESIAKRRQQEAAYEDFEAETDNSEGEVRDYMVMTEATYDPNDYNSMADLQEAQEVEPSNDGSLSIGLLS